MSKPTAVSVLLKPTTIEFCTKLQEADPALTLSRIVNNAVAHFASDYRELANEDNRNDQDNR